MQNIFILGSGRTGKSTLARMIKTKAPQYNLIHTDALRAAIMQDLPPKFADEILHYEANDYFANLLLGFLQQQTKQDFNQQNYILEGTPIYPHHLTNRISNHQAKFIFLGHGNLNAAEIATLIRQHDTKQDWSYYLNDDELHARAERFWQLDQTFQSECKKYNFPYYDTSQNRNKILTQILEQIAL